MMGFHAFAAGAVAFAFVPFAVNECGVCAFSTSRRRHHHQPPSISRRQIKKDDLEDIEITTIEQAQELRRRAQVLRTEAEAAERKLRDESNARKRERDADMDVFIATETPTFLHNIS